MDVNNPRAVNRAARLMLKLKPRGNIKAALREEFTQLVQNIISGEVRKRVPIAAVPPEYPACYMQR